MYLCIYAYISVLVFFFGRKVANDFSASCDSI